MYWPLGAIILTLLLTVPLFRFLFRWMQEDLTEVVREFYYDGNKTVMVNRRRIKWVQ